MDLGHVNFVQTTGGFDKVEYPIDEWLDLSVPWIINWNWIIKPINPIRSISLIELQKGDWSFPYQPRGVKVAKKTKEMVQAANRLFESSWDHSFYMYDSDSSFNGSLRSTTDVSSEYGYAKYLVKNNTRFEAHTELGLWKYHHSFGSIFERSLGSITDHYISDIELIHIEDIVQDNTRPTTHAQLEYWKSPHLSDAFGSTFNRSFGVRQLFLG